MDADAKMMLPLFSIYVMFDADSAPVCVSLMFAAAVVGVLQQFMGHGWRAGRARPAWLIKGNNSCAIVPG